MSLSKKKSRAIHVDGTDYRFQISTTLVDDSQNYSLNLTVQIASGHGSVMKVVGLFTRDSWVDCADSKKVAWEDWGKTYLIAGPRHVSKLIRRGKLEGWVPTKLGSPFNLEVEYDDVFEGEGDQTESS